MIWLPLVLSSIAGSAHAADDVKTTPHLAVHLRPNVRANPAFGAGADDTSVQIQQGIRAGLEASKGGISGRVDLQEVRRWGDRSGTTGTEAAVHAYQGYLQFKTNTGWLRVGRQEIHLLDGAYLSKAPWNPAGRSLDAVRLHHGTDNLEVDAFASQLKSSTGWSDAETPPDLGDWFGGATATLKGFSVVKPSLFVLAKYGGPSEASPDRHDQWVGPGARLVVDYNQTALDLNTLVQIGDVSGTPRQAYSIIARVEQRLNLPLSPGIALRFDQSSGHACTEEAGSDTCTSDVNRTLDLQWGRNHYYRGLADQVAATNSRHMAAELFAKPANNLHVELIGSFFQLTNPEGPWMRNGGKLQGSGWKPGNEDATLGAEVDARIAWKAGKHMKIDGGLSLFQPLGVGKEMAGGDLQTYCFTRMMFAL